MTIEVKELRRAERYVAVEQLAGSYGAVSVIILDLSDAGVQIEHAQPLRVGMRARFWFRCGAASVSGQAATVWSHLARTPEKLLYRSGIKLDDGVELVAALRSLADQGVIRRDLESLERKRRLLIAREREKSGKPVMTLLRAEPDVPADQRLLIEQVRSRLRANPDETARLYERIAAGDRRDERQDVLAVWEYLERTIELATIVKVFEKSG
jgi:hypothetical protein